LDLLTYHLFLELSVLKVKLLHNFIELGLAVRKRGAEILLHDLADLGFVYLEIFGNQKMVLWLIICKLVT